MRSAWIGTAWAWPNTHPPPTALVMFSSLVIQKHKRWSQHVIPSPAFSCLCFSLFFLCLSVLSATQSSAIVRQKWRETAQSLTCRCDGKVSHTCHSCHMLFVVFLCTTLWIICSNTNGVADRVTCEGSRFCRIEKHQTGCKQRHKNTRVSLPTHLTLTIWLWNVQVLYFNTQFKLIDN